MGNVKIFDDFMMYARVLHFTCDRVDCYSEAYLYTCIADYILK